MPVEAFNPEKDMIEPVDQMPEWDSDPQTDPTGRTAELPDAEQDWTEVHPNGSKAILEAEAK